MLLYIYIVVPPHFDITTNSRIMSTIQQIIDTHTSKMLAAMEDAMQEQLRDFKEKLIETLADKYEFDVDEAKELFPDSVAPAVVSQKQTKKDKKKDKKKEKKTKDPNAPKRATTAYFFFMKDKRAEVSQEFPHLKTTEITSKLGAMWQLIKDTPEADPYNLLNSTDKTRYESELELYTPSSSD